MTKTKRTRIHIETDELVIVRRIDNLKLSWCEQCAAQTYLVTADEAALLLGVGPEVLDRQAKAGRPHLLESAEGKTLVCLRLP